MYSFWSDILFQNIILDGAAQRRNGAPCRSAAAMYIAQMMAAGLLMVMEVVTWSQRDAVKNGLHILQTGHGHAALAELAPGPVVVVVVAVEGGHIEGDAEAGFTLVQQKAEPLVGLARFAKPGKHPHRPQAGAVAGGMHAPQVGILSRQSDIAPIVAVGNVRRAVHRG